MRVRVCRKGGHVCEYRSIEVLVGLREKLSNVAHIRTRGSHEIKPFRLQQGGRVVVLMGGIV